MSSSRILPLEVCRGVAAVIVFAIHFSLAFSPGLVGLIRGTPLFLLFNGRGAVIFFFVLSGYVLTLPYYRNDDPTALAKGALKRLPRLAGITTLVCLASWLLFHTGAYHYDAASTLTRSEWLLTCGYSSWPEGTQPSFWVAFSQGAWKTFLRGDQSMNTNLWTMNFEFIGSLLVYGLAMPLRKAFGPRRAIFGAALAGLPFLMTHPNYLAFISGTTLALLHTSKAPRLSNIKAPLLLALSLLLLSYESPERWYAFLDLAHYGVIAEWPKDLLKAAILVGGSTLLIHVTMGSPRLYSSLSNTGALGRALGQLSFPFYLCHTLVIWSFSSWLFIRIHTWLPAPLTFVTTGLATLGVVLAVAWPLAYFDSWWTQLTNRWVGRILAPPV